MIPPPKIPTWFFHWFCRKDLHKYLEGDLFELYAHLVQTKSKRQADWLYFLEVLKLLRPGIIRSNCFFPLKIFKTMFKHHLFSALRNFQKHSSPFLINLIGLTTAFTCAMFILIWVEDERSVNKFHENDNHLYRVMEIQTYSNNRLANNATPGILAEYLKEDFPEIRYATGTSRARESQLSVDEQSYRENGLHVDIDFLKMFSYPLIAGNIEMVLANKSSICISERLATKLFGSYTAALGKTIRYEDRRDFDVSGVFQDVPVKSTLQFDYLLPYEVYKEENQWVTGWGNNGPHTFVMLHPGVDANEVTEKIANYINEKDEERNTVELFLKRYSEQYLYGNFTDGYPNGGRITYVRLFTLIAIILLLIACINFMNLSTATASKRAKEVGVRKAVGAHRNVLVYQYLTESVLTSFFAIIIALTLVFLLLPHFNEVTGKAIVFTLTWQKMGVITLSIFISGLLAGSYPAIYLSHFNPTVIFKGDIKSSLGELWVRKGLVIFQFTATIVLMIGVIMVQKQIQYAFNKNLGYDRENVVIFRQDGNIPSKREAFFNELRSLPGVVSASSSSHNMLQQMTATMGLEWEGKPPGEEIIFENIRVDEYFIKTMGMKLIAGRWFSKEFGADTTRVVINESTLEVMGFEAEEVLGKRVRLWDQYDLQVIGVLADFHYESIHTKVSPSFFWPQDRRLRYVAVRIDGEYQPETIAAIENLYKSFNPGFVFDCNFLDSSYQELYNAERQVGKLSSYFAGITILISCLGLFGLAAFTAQSRTREIGIRKVLGASPGQIVWMLSSSFTKLVAIALAIALPISYYAVAAWLDSFAYQTGMSFWVFGVSGLLSLLIAGITVSSQTIKVANINPSKTLKQE